MFTFTISLLFEISNLWETRWSWTEIEIFLLTFAQGILFFVHSKNGHFENFYCRGKIFQKYIFLNCHILFVRLQDLVEHLQVLEAVVLVCLRWKQKSLHHSVDLQVIINSRIYLNNYKTMFFVKTYLWFLQDSLVQNTKIVHPFPDQNGQTVSKWELVKNEMLFMANRCLANFLSVLCHPDL